MTPSDPRLTLARADLADARLEGLIRAGRFAVTRPMTCRAAQALVRKTPDTASAVEDQLLFGEAFDVLEERDGWAWGQARRDGYVGFVALESLAPAGNCPTHWLRAPSAHGFAEASLKSASRGPFSMNALFEAGEERNGFVDAGEAGWIHQRALAPIGEYETDRAAVAEQFLGTPYLWGCRDRQGLDCSGLVQQTFYACGLACPRDSDQQMAAFPADADPAALARGDLVFWRGHVATMLDADRIIHANAHHMAVVIEPLAVTVDRVRAAGSGDPIGYRRP